MELDPRNVKILASAIVTYEVVRDYKKAREVADRLIALEPNNIAHRRGRAHIDIRERADTRPLHALDKMFCRLTRNVLSSRFIRAGPCRR